MMKLTCSSCQKPLSIDESKLPMHEVSFACPGCQARIMVDRRTMAVAEDLLVSSTEEPLEDEDKYGDRALVVGGSFLELRPLLRQVGLRAVASDSPEAAREAFLRDLPKAVIFQPAQMAAPPLVEFAPMMSFSAADRRKSFFILIADNLRTFDGNAAFLYQVNLVVAKKDLASFPVIYREAMEHHARLYGAVRDYHR